MYPIWNHNIRYRDADKRGKEKRMKTDRNPNSSTFIYGSDLGSSALFRLVFQQLERFLQLKVFSRSWLCGRSRSDVALVISLLWLFDGVVVVTRQVIGVNRFGNVLSFNFHRRRDT